MAANGVACQSIMDDGTPLICACSAELKAEFCRSFSKKLQEMQVVNIKVSAASIDSKNVKLHPDGTGALKKRRSSHRKILRRMDHKDALGCWI
jgi:hypothetical protein